MWIADQWKDYEVIDCSKRRKGGTLGEIISWCARIRRSSGTRQKNNRCWKKMNAHYHRSKKGGGEWEFFGLPEQWSISTKPWTFQLKPFSFKHTGLFPERGGQLGLVLREDQKTRTVRSRS